MGKNVRELEQEVEALKNELMASMRREELLINPTGGVGTLKSKIKRTRLGRLIADSNSKLGKIARSPRTLYRIVRHPGVIKEIRQKSGSTMNGQGGDFGAQGEMFVPVRFFYNEGRDKRVNLVAEKLEPELLKMATMLAEKEDCGLRVVTYGEEADPLKYDRMIDDLRLPKVKRISFYSSIEQMRKNKIFELEVGENDVFITKAWRGNE